MPHSLPLITIFVLNWNRRDELREALRSLEQQTYPNLEIVVADSASTDGAPEMVESEFPQVRLVRLGGNFGCPEGRNRGMAHVRTELVFCMDNDAQLHAEAVANAYQIIASHERLAVVGGVIKLYGDVSEVDLHCPISDEKPRYAETFSGGISLLRKSAFDEVGGYPSYTMYGGEEGRLSLRLWDHGWRLANAPSVVLWHRRSAAQRNPLKELISRHEARLRVRLELFPLELALLALLNACIKAPIAAIKAGMFVGWIRQWTPSFIKSLGIILRRRPVSRRTVARVFGFRYRPVTVDQPPEALDVTYGQVVRWMVMGQT